MKQFSDMPAYLRAFAKAADLAIISVGLAAKALEVKRPTIENRMRRGALEGIKIGANVYVRTSSVAALIQAEDAVEAKVMSILKKVSKSRTVIQYAPLMDQIGLDYRISPDRNKIGAILGRLSHQTFADHKVLISVLVVDKKTGQPSSSFQWLYEQLTGKTWTDKAFTGHCEKVYQTNF